MNYRLFKFFLNAKGVSDFLYRRECQLFGIANDPYGDEEEKRYIASSVDPKDALVLLGLGRMIYKFTHYYCIEHEVLIDHLVMDYLDQLHFIGKSNRLYRLRIRSPLLGGAISRSRILEIVNLYVDSDSISFRLAKNFLYNRYQNEEGENCILN